MSGRGDFLISVEGATFTYEGRERASLADVSIQVAPGECVLVAGPSGCGKSTLLRLMNGLVPHYHAGVLEGSVQVAGRDPAQLPLHAQAGVTSTVFQNPRTQFYTTDTTSELAFALENLGMPAPEITARIERSVDQTGIADLMGCSLFALSGGQKQKIACVCSDVTQTQIVLLDEPTANLDHAASIELARTVRRWKEQGKTVVIAEHRIAWVLDVVDRMLVMEHGRIVEEIAASDLRTIDEAFCAGRGLRSPVLADPLDIAVHPRGGASGASTSAGDDLVVEGLRFGYRKGALVLDIDCLSIPRGVVTVVVGSNGRGKTTLLRCLAGLELKDKSVVRCGADVWRRRDRLRHAFLVWQDVNCQLFTQSVREEVQISLPDGVGGGQVDEILESLDLLDAADRDPFTLSGGQQQRVAIACAVASGRELLLFDEPTSGLDRAHMLAFADLLQGLAAEGRTVVVVTHDSELVATAADHVIHLE